MSIQAKLIIDDDTEINVLQFNFSFSKQADSNGRPTSKAVFNGLNLTIESRKDLNLTDWAIAQNETRQIELHIYPRVMGDKTRKLLLYDCHLLGLNNEFSATGSQPMSEMLRLSCGGFKDANTTEEYSSYWRKTFTSTNDAAPTIIEKPKPKIVSVNWIHPETKETLTETAYTQQVTLIAQIENKESDTANITITKEDGTEFESGTTELTFEENITEEGVAELTALDIKEEWLDFKTASIDKLVAKVTHGAAKKKSKSLKIIPPPQVLVSFRPNDSWKGEFGFDWIRKDDTSLFKDEKFEDIISKQYKESSFTTLETDSNKYKGYFKKDPIQFESLKNKYPSLEIDWKKVTDTSGAKVNYKHHTEWLSLKKGKEAKVKIHIDVTEKADYLEFDTQENFTITPKKIDIKNKTGFKKLTDVVTITCDKEFGDNQEIIIKAYKENQKERKEAGKINVWANDASKHKQKKVVFVQVKTPPISSRRKEKPDATSEKTRINKYLAQAYIELHPDSLIVDLDLSADADFSKFIKSNKIQSLSDAVPAVPAVAATATTPAVPAKPAIPKKSLTKYLKAKLKAVDAKYDGDEFFKAFYFAEDGYHASGGNLSGFSAHNADYVVVFKSANDQTAAHEFLHSFNLAHTFTNVEASATAEFTYTARETDNLLDYSHNISSAPNNNNRCSLYYWQWITANNSI